MLLSSLKLPNDGIYLIQYIGYLNEAVQESAFRRAWDRAVQRHAVLRTAFLWQDQDEPLQVVQEQATIAWQIEDWRGVPAGAQASRLEAFLIADRRSGFNLSAAPLMRMTLFRQAEAAYVSVWTFHHAILDGRSVARLVHEVFEDYQALCQGQDADIPAPPPFREHVLALQNLDLSDAERYWRAELGDFIASTPLGVDHLDGEKGDQSFGYEDIRLDRESSNRLRNLVAQNSVTLNTIMQGAWAILLSRYSGSEDVLFGAVRACRHSTVEGAEDMVGLLLNTVPLRVRVPRSALLLPWLKELRKRWIGLRPYENTPLVQVQQWSGVRGMQPLFESVVMFEDQSPVSGFKSPGGEWERRRFVVQQRPDSPLSLTIYAEPEIYLKLLYVCNRFSASAVRRMLGHLRVLLEGFIANPEQRIASFPILTDAERVELLEGWSQTSYSSHPAQTFPALFEQQVLRTPSDPAVIYHNEHSSYAELNQRANQLAHYLLKSGAGPDVLVGLCLERSIDQIVALLGILKSGCAYIPLDPTYPVERISYMLSDSKAPLLITRKRDIAEIPVGKAQIIDLDESWELIAQEPKTNPPLAARPEDLAYAIYTSGSTGQPKGVLVEHSQVVNYALAAVEQYDFQTGDQFAMLQPLTFDSCLSMLFTALACGGTVHLIGRELALDVVQLADYCHRNLIDHLKITPSLLSMLLNADPNPHLIPQKTLIMGGEVSHWSLIEKIHQLGAGCNIWNHYGPTETTVGVLTYPIPNKSAVDELQNLRTQAASVPIGYPFGNNRVYILDADLQPVPMGVIGELFIGGLQVTRGYLNRVALTAERFLPDPYSSIKGRMFRTGDRARFLPNRAIEFMGRTDDQLKIHGFRIETGEIEKVLGEYPGISERLVMAFKDSFDQAYLAAYCVPVPGYELGPLEVRNFLKQHLPTYMVPSRILVIERLPRTAHGKVDRKALPLPDASPFELQEEFEAPRGPVEETIAGIWREVLGGNRIGRQDNFFDLGGHSLLAIRVMSRIVQRFQLDIPVSTLFEQPSIAKLAEQVSQLKLVHDLSHEEDRFEPIAMAAVANQERHPLSFAQLRIWFLDRLRPGQPTHNIPRAFRVSGRLDESILERSLVEIVHRHDTLRTNFMAESGSVYSIVRPAEVFALAKTDFSQIPSEERETKALELMADDSRRLFDLSLDIPFYARLITLSAQEHFLVIIIHHIASDAWSNTIFWQELNALYAAYSAGKPSPLEEIPIRYAEYAAWQQKYVETAGFKNQLAYWRGQFQVMPEIIRLPTDYQPPAYFENQGSTLSCLLSRELTQALADFSTTERVSLFMTVLATFYILLGRLSGQENITIGTPIAGRGRIETEKLIGVFLNHLVLRIDLSGSPTFRQVLERVRLITLEAYNNQDVPFEMLLQELQPERNLSRTPLFQVFFNMHNFPEVGLHQPELRSETVPLDRGQANFDLEIYVEELNGQIKLILSFRQALFKPERMAELLGEYSQLLAQIVERPDLPIGAYSLLTPSARSLFPDPTETLSDAWNGSVQAALVRSAQRHPEKIALIDRHGCWSYGELDERSSQVAHYLLASGLQTGEVVAVYAHRSAALVWALMSVLKAGGAFLILDPAYPAQRLVAYLESARPGAWIQLVAAGDLPRELQQWLDASGLACCISLPASNDIQAGGFWQEYPASSPQVEIGPDSLAGITFTSGSMGVPKGVLARHGSLTHFLPWQAQVFKLDDTDNFSMLSGLAHDPLQRDIFTALWVGGTICIPDAEQFFTPGWLVEWMSEQGITFAHLTPPMARLITETARIGCRMEHLRYAFFVGDKLTRNDVANLKEIAPRVIAINSYGATETQRAVGYYILPPEQDDQRSLPLYPIGCGMPDAQLLILNENGQLAGLGELGEIYVRSPHLALGYLDDPQLTQSRFIINPFTGISTDRLYRTGDLGRYRSDGQVDFQGRRDTQVKIRGFRVEPGEIESALEQHPQVRGAVVVPDTDPSNATTLNAYIVPIEGAQLKPQEIRQYLARGLPEFMLPASYILMAALPLTPNGKVNLKALPEPDPSRDRLQDEFVAPRNPTEKIIARIWSEVLELDQVGIYDNFFDLNGHSLLAIRLINKLDNLFQVQIPLRSIFEAPTVETLATVLRQISGEPEQVDRTAQLILKLAEMSEADAQDLLEDRQADLH